MSLVIELLHQYTRLLDIKGEQKKQHIYLSKEGAKEFHDCMFQKGNSIRYSTDAKDGVKFFSMDGYDFTIYETINKK